MHRDWDWFGNVGVDIFKAALAFSVGEAALIILGLISAMPILVGAFVVIGASIVIDILFSKYQVSDTVVSGLKNATS